MHKLMYHIIERQVILLYLSFFLLLSWRSSMIKIILCRKWKKKRKVQERQNRAGKIIHRLYPSISLIRFQWFACIHAHTCTKAWEVTQMICVTMVKATQEKKSNIEVRLFTSKGKGANHLVEAFKNCTSRTR